MTATLPSTWILAPRRTSSLTCMKRFSKIVSVTVAVPWAMQLSAMNCACMSVGKPGYSVVRKPWALSVAPPSALHADAAVHRLHGGAGFAQLFDDGIEVVGAAMAHGTTSPPWRPRRTGRCPLRCGRPPRGGCSRAASRRPGCGCGWCRGLRSSRPWRSASRPGRKSRAPCAAFSSTVSPSASAAAIMKFSVPVTVTMSVVMRAPFRRFQPAGSLAIM